MPLELREALERYDYGAHPVALRQHNFLELPAFERIHHPIELPHRLANGRELVVAYPERGCGGRRGDKRALVEEPVLYVGELEPAEQDTYRSQRHRLEPELEWLTGLQAERRAEGSALVDHGKRLTDIRFPTRSTESQLALVLCERLRAAAYDAERNPLPRSEVGALLAELRERFDLDAGHELDEAALSLLESHRLIIPAEPAQLRVLPAIARFSRPTLRRRPSG